jgi:hypothetical protein
MNKQNLDSPALRSRFRRSIVQLGSLIAVALLILGIAGLFSVWTLNREHLAADQRASRVMSAVNLGRSAQVHFKIQVQEWKNILLRGDLEADSARYVKAFAKEASAVQSDLSRVASEADRLGMRDIAAQARAIGHRHGALGVVYNAALSEARKGQWNPFGLDRKLRGIDRQLNEQFDRLAGALLTAAKARQDEAARTAAARYETLRNFITQALLLSFALIVVILWRAISPKGDGA